MMNIQTSSPIGSSPLDATLSLRRSRRVIFLSTALVLMGLGDLYATCIHSSTIGMHELNPLAAPMLNTGQYGWVIAYKLLSMGLCVSLLFWGRRHRIVEVTTWALVLVMVALTFYWGAYNRYLADELPLTATGANYYDFRQSMQNMVGFANEP